MAIFADGVTFVPTAGGTTDWTVSAAASGFMTPALAGAVNGGVYKYRAESADLSQWEIGEGTYNSGTGVLTRTTVLFNSSGTGTAVGQSGAGTKINFTLAPNVGIVALKEDLVPSGTQAFVQYQYTATANQTVFSGADRNTLTLQYTVGNVIVMLNGDMLSSGKDFTATDGSTVTLTSGVTVNDEVVILALSGNAVTNYNTAAQYEFTATAAQTVFTGADLNGATLATNGFFTIVALNGRIIQPTTDYTMTSTTVTLTAGATAGDLLSVITINTNNLSAITQPQGDNSTKMATTAYVDRLFHRNYISALTLSTSGSSTTFSVATGCAADSTNTTMIQLASAMSKTTAAWVAGTGNGGLDTGAIAASTWYHAHLIYNPTTAAVDVLVSLSATAPTLPTGYTLFRRIGSMKTNGSSQWTGFNQYGNDFVWTTTVQDFNGTITSTPSTQTLASVPTGVVVKWKGAIVHQTTTNEAGGRIVDLNRTSAVPSIGSAADEVHNVIGGATITRIAGRADAFTNTSAQVSIEAPLSGTFSVNTIGWEDSRGRDG